MIQQEEVQIGAVLNGPDADPHVAAIQCTECRHVFIASTTNTWSEDWHTVWPLVTAEVPLEVPEPVRSATAEALLCLAIGAFGGCLMMCRTTIIRLQREQNAESLKDLKDKGKISQQLYDQGNEVRLWANMVGHEDYPSDAVDSETCQELVGYVQSLLEAVYVQSARQARLRERRKQAESQRSKN